MNGSRDATSPLASASPDALLSSYLQPGELAHELGVSTRTLARWAALRLGPPRTAVGRTVLYRRAAVLAWLAAREAAAEPEPGSAGR